MGLLDKLWDDTVAGPRPDTGLGRLRKQPARPAAVKINDPAGDASAFVPPSPASGSEETPVKVTRSIMIKRPAGYPSSPRSAASTPPASPLGTTPPISPELVLEEGTIDSTEADIVICIICGTFENPSVKKYNNLSGRFRRKSLSDAYERASPPGTTSHPSPFEV
nr:unnamed protein product [Digitaria exilis]